MLFNCKSIIDYINNESRHLDRPGEFLAVELKTDSYLAALKLTGLPALGLNRRALLSFCAWVKKRKDKHLNIYYYNIQKMISF